MRWEDIRNLEGSLPTITVTQQKTGSVVVIPIAEPLRRALQAIPETERQGNLLGEIGQAYLQGRRRRFISAWRALLEDVELSTLVDAPVIAKVETTGASGRARYAWTFHSWRHTTATSLNGPEAHYLLGHRSDDEKRLGTALQYRHEDLQRLKAQLDAYIPRTRRQGDPHGTERVIPQASAERS
jgi:integrase